MKNFLGFSLIILVMSGVQVWGAAADPTPPSSSFTHEFYLKQDMTQSGSPLFIEASSTNLDSSANLYHSVSYSKLRQSYLLKDMDGTIVSTATAYNRKTAEGLAFTEIELKTSNGKRIGKLEFYRQEGNAVIRNAQGQILYFSDFTDESGSRMLIRDIHGNDLVWLERPYSSWVKEGDRWRIRINGNQKEIDPRFFFFLANWISTSDEYAKSVAFYSYLGYRTYQYGVGILQSFYFFDNTLFRMNKQYDYHFVAALRVGLDVSSAKKYKDKMESAKSMENSDPVQAEKERLIALAIFYKLPDPESFPSAAAAYDLLNDENGQKRTVSEFLNDMESISPKDIEAKKAELVAKFRPTYKKKALQFHTDKFKVNWKDEKFRSELVEDYISGLEKTIRKAEADLNSTKNTKNDTPELRADRKGKIEAAKNDIKRVNQYKAAIIANSDWSKMTESEKQLIGDFQKPLEDANATRFKELVERQRQVDEFFTIFTHVKKTGTLPGEEDGMPEEQSRAEKGVRGFRDYIRSKFRILKNRIFGHRKPNQEVPSDYRGEEEKESKTGRMILSDGSSNVEE